jgi:hypothetical protein
MKKMLNRDVLGKIGTLLLAVAVWYVIRQRTELHPGRQPDPPAQLPSSR